MSFKVSPKAKAIINGGFVLQFYDGVHPKILSSFLEVSLKHIKMDMTKLMYSHILNAVLLLVSTNLEILLLN